VNKLFMGIPKSFYIPNKATQSLVQIIKPDYCRNIIELISKVPDGSKQLLKHYLVELIAERYYEETVVKMIPVSIFEKGSVSYGFCDQISYWGGYFLDICDFRAQQLELERIAWAKVKIGLYVNNLEKILEDQKTLEINDENTKYITSINPHKVINWPADKPRCPILYNRKLHPFAITSATAEYEDIIATWDLDFVSIKRDYKTKDITNAYGDRPVQIATTKAMKALAKQFYGRILNTELGVADGGEDDPDLLLNIQAEPEMPKIPDAKNSFVDQKLIELETKS